MDYVKLKKDELVDIINENNITIEKKDLEIEEKNKELLVKDTKIAELIASMTELHEINVVDVNGRTVKTITNSLSSEMEINVSDLTSGIYMLNVKTDEVVATSKFIKN